MTTAVAEILGTTWRTEAIAPHFAQDRFAVIPDFLEHHFLQDVQRSIAEREADFALRVNWGFGTLTVPEQKALSRREQQVLAAQLALGDRQGLVTFIYRRLLPHAECTQHALCQLAQWCTSPACFDLIGELTGEQIVYAELSGVTRYATGHYVSPHSDRSVRRHGVLRKFAFNLNLGADRDASMGGVLTLVNKDGTERPLDSRTNQLTLLDVYGWHQHRVTPVASDGGERMNLIGFFYI